MEKEWTYDESHLLAIISSLILLQLVSNQLITKKR